jgi:Predicted transcriptional regulator
VVAVTDNDLNKLGQAQRERLAHIDFTLFFRGEANRTSLTERFGVAPSVATQDFSRYKDFAPENAIYDEKRRLHIKSTNFKPLFNYDVARTLSTLSEGFGDGFMGAIKSAISCESPFRLNKPDLQLVATISESIYRKLPLTITYVSPSSGPSTRTVIPHTIVDNGIRWHFRAFDRKRSEFRDFVLTRIDSASLDNSEVEEHELIAKDKQWQRIVELELIPHPSIKYPKAIMRDYGMHEGVLHLDVRAAFAGYLLNLWQVDCSTSPTLEPCGFLLALKNPEALYGVDNAILAPGYCDPRGS